MEANEFFNKLFKFLDEGVRPDAIDFIYNTLDNLLLAKNYEPVISILVKTQKYIINEKMPLSALLSILTITRAWKDVLGPERAVLVEKIRYRALIELSKREAELCLSGLT